MITEVVTKQGKRIYVLSKSDIDATRTGERLRAFCPIHQSDHQRSLSISRSGWGFCHNCGATVFVEECNFQIAATLKRGTERRGNIKGQPDQADSRQARSGRRPRSPITPSDWQQQEVAALAIVGRYMCEELSSRRAQAYLDERAIPPQVAASSGIGYLSRACLEGAALSLEQRKLLARWVGRVVFPLRSPDGRGFIGRSLIGWEVGMDENRHKEVLEKRGVRRWVKTNPAGWFGSHPSNYSSTIALVEGGFDRLALIASGGPPDAIVALVGTAAGPLWIIEHAPQVRRVVLSLDSDEGGQGAMERLAGEFQHAGLAVLLCPPPQDSWGKDWSERVRRIGPQAAWPLMAALAS